ncbi:MAG: 1-(5-phosphoribosyl)-5-[(5-phosphoribosylamino)methylideneamino]imidazole-4-carboxamide isomerase [Candidatus Omnitrophota bacterium]
MKIIPAIDLIDGKTVRLKQGEYDRKISYDIDPIEAARKWGSMGAELIHIVDLDGAREGRPMNLDVVEKIIGAVNVPVEVGGGFRNKEDIQLALARGVSRVVVGSKAFEEIDFAEDCIISFGEKVILSADAKNFKPQVHGWETALDMDLFEILKKFVSFGAKEIIFTDIQKDGMLTGPSIDSLKKILEEVDVKIVSAGGVKTVEDVRELKKLEDKGLSGVIIGRALYEGTIGLKEAINAGKKNNTMS